MNLDYDKLLSRFQFTKSIDALFPDKVFHIRATDKATGSHGFGSGLSIGDATLKAVMESIERSVFLDYLKRGQVHTSNGFAAGSSPEGASKAATRELIERHVVLSLWFEKNNFGWRRREEFFPLALSSEASRVGLEIYVTRPIEAPSDYGVCLLALVCGAGEVALEVGPVLAATCKATLEQAQISLGLDVCRVVSMIQNRRQSKPLVSVSQSPRTPGEHMDWYMDPQNGKLLKSWVLLPETSFETPSAETLDHTRVEIVKQGTLDGLGDWSVALAKNSSLINYFVGRAPAEFLKRFGLESDDPFGIHPLG